MPTPFAPTTVRELAARLERQRANAHELLDSLRAEADSALEGLDISDVFDDDAPGTGDGVADRDRARWLAARTARDLAEIDAALARLRLGCYGQCVRCDGRIPIARLRALPQAALCLPCSASRGFPIRRRTRRLTRAGR